MYKIKDRNQKLEQYRERARALVAQMTLKEKISQMLSWAPAIPRLGIPAYNWWNEGIHGVGRAGTATVFPQAVGLATSFDEDLLGRVGEAVGTEARGKYNMYRSYQDRDIYKGLTIWAPNVNIFRDPCWGRGHETYGEDPYLTSRLGVRFVQGMQGDDPDYLRAAACAKHFAVHSGPEDQRHYFDAKVSRQDLWETYLPAFRALVKEAGVEAVMGAYNRTNGEPCCGSKTLLVDILRGKWNFQGYVTSDCWAIKDFHEGHMVTSGPVDSVALAVNNGCDLNCGDLYAYLEEAVAEGKVKEETIDRSLVRLFTTRMKLGMFDAEEKVPYNKIGYDAVDSRAMQALNLEVAEKILVLLKNENHTLPLDKSKLHRVAVVGPNADNRKALVGNYEGTASRYVTVLDGIQEYLGEDVQVRYSEGCHLYADKIQGLAKSNELISEVRGVCAECDVVICCLGLDAGLEGEEGDQGNQFASGDKQSLSLPGNQESVLKACIESGKPMVVVLSGSALALGTAQEGAAAVLQAWYPGAQGGRAVARALFGECNPQGKLPVTFYHSDEDFGITELSSSSFGQTFKVTALQLITAVSAAVNGGQLMQPYVVKQIVDEDKNVVSETTPVVKRQVISNETSATMGALCESVVSDGSGRKAQLPGFRIGGKTGTSEKLGANDSEWKILSFVGFAPADDPQIAILVMLDEPKLNDPYGSTIAAPIVKNMLADILPYLGFEAELDVDEDTSVETPYLTDVMLEEAQAQLIDAGLKARIVGEGDSVLKQVPQAGYEIPYGGTVILYTDETELAENVPVPNVLGKTGKQANAAILNAGLNIKIEGDFPDNVQTQVVSQSPLPDEKVQPGTVVTVTVHQVGDTSANESP